MFERAEHILLVGAVCLTMHLRAGQKPAVLEIIEGPATPAKWQVVNDDVMGGISTSRMRVATDGNLVFEGTLSLENNGGFASVRSLPALRDLKDRDAFVVRVRGDGRRYKFTVRTDRGSDSAIYQAAFTTRKGEWEEHRLAFKDFLPTFRGRVLLGEPPLDPAKVTAVGFLISDKQAGPFSLEIAWIRASRTAVN